MNDLISRQAAIEAIQGIDYVNIVCYYSVVGRPTESEKKKHDLY